MERFTAAIFVAFATWLTPRICAAQCGPPPRNPSQCVVWTCNAADPAWESVPRPAGFVCDDHNA